MPIPLQCLGETWLSGAALACTLSSMLVFEHLVAVRALSVLPVAQACSESHSFSLQPSSRSCAPRQRLWVRLEKRRSCSAAHLPSTQTWRMQRPLLAATDLWRFELARQRRLLVALQPLFQQTCCQQQMTFSPWLMT